MTPTRDELEHYVIGAYDGDVGALEAQLADDPAARAIVADEASFDLLLRDAAAAATFCPGCDDVVSGDRCDACGAAVRPGGYTALRVLVSNAHGRMYVAHDLDGKHVALKELAFVQSPGAETVAAFEREAKFLRALEHPGIPRFCAAFEEGTGVHTRYYLAQELVSGVSLADRLADHWYAEKEILDIARQVLVVLAYLQSLSPMVFHRDIKPANLIRRADGTIAVVDFGAAHVQGTTVGSTTIGTFGYMPVEQMAGQVDATTDGYALGATLLHLLTRTEPWRLLQGAVLGPVNVSAPVRAFLHKLTAPEPRDRYANAAAALAALDRIERGEAPMDFVETKQPRWYVRHAALAIAIAAVASAGIGIAAYAAFRDAVDGPRDVAVPAPPAPPYGVEPAIAPGTPAPAAGVRPKVPSKRPPPIAVPAGKPINLDFKKMPLADVLRLVGDACELNIVLPDDIDATLTERLNEVPCDQAFEVLLESHGLWYDYQPFAKLVRVAPRKQLDLEAEDAIVREQNGDADDQLPSGITVDLDFKNAPLRDLIQMLADTGKVSVVIPDDIGGMVTIRAKGVMWDDALRAVLASKGLWYRYRDNGKVLRIAPRKQLDLEHEDELVRQQERGQP